MGEQAKKRFIINVIFVSLWIGLIILSGKFLLRNLLPFVIAVIVASLMQRPAKFFCRATKIPKGICAAFLSALLYIILAIALIFCVTKFFSFTGKALSSLSGIGEMIMEAVNRLKIVLGAIVSNFSPDFEQASEQILSTVLQSVTEKTSEYMSDTAASIIKSAPSFLFSSVVALAASCYIGKDYDGLVEFLKVMMGEKTVKNVVKIKGILKESVIKIVGGYLILMVITFLELSVGFLILGIKNWFLIAVIIAVIDALPALGTGAVLLPWAIINILLGNSFLGISLMILYIFVTIIRNFAEPKIVGSKTGINPLFILFSMFLGIRLFGFFGLIILPVTFIVVVKYYKNEMENETSHC